MPMVRVEMSKGRTQEQKQQVAQAITDSMVQVCACAPDTVHVVFVDVEPSDWAIAGKFLGKLPGA